jgi:hypothetical protein
MALIKCKDIDDPYLFVCKGSCDLAVMLDHRSVELGYLNFIC